MGHHDVFISYSREDRPKVERIATALTERGLRVWWDPKIKTGAGFRQEISEALSSTRSVIVIWSRHSVASRFVADEADEGAAREILFPALIDNVDIPLGFRQIQTADLTHWRGNLNDNAFKAFLDTVVEGAKAMQGAQPAREPEPEPAREPDAVPAETPPPAPKPAPRPAARRQSTNRKAAKYTTTGSKRRFALFGQAILMASLVAGAFGALAYASDFVFETYRPFFIGAMGVLAFLSRYGTLEADRSAGAASLALLPRSYMALILFSLIAIAPLVLEGRLYAAALEGVQVKGIEGADINNVSYNDDSTLIVTASDDNTMKLWDAGTGIERAEFTGHREACQDEEGRCWVWGGDISPDGSIAVTASRDLTAIIWNTADASPMHILSGHLASVYDAAFSPITAADGGNVATASSDNTIKIWSTETGETIRTLNGHSDNVNAIDFSPDGELLVSASDDGMVSIWDWQNGRRLGSVSAGGKANDAKFSKDGTKFAAAADNGVIRIWSTNGRTRIASFNHGAARAFGVAFADEDKLLATSGIDPVIKLWNVSSGQMVRELEGHRDGVRGLDSSWNGEFIISGSRDNTARIWNAKTGKNAITMGHIKSAIDLPVSLDLPPLFVSSQAPVPVDFMNEPETGARQIAKGFIIAFGILLFALVLKGFFWIIGLRPLARIVVVGSLFAVSAYAGMVIATTLPAEALALWTTIAFIPATVFALLRWAWRALILRNFNRRTRKA